MLILPLPTREVDVMLLNIKHRFIYNVVKIILVTIQVYLL